MTTPAGPTPAPINWANLIQAGRDLLNPQQSGQLSTHEHVRRAASNAYYAMFHALAQSNATALVALHPIRPRPQRGPESTVAWTTPPRDGNSSGTARNSPSQQEISPTPLQISKSAVTRPTTIPTPSLRPTTAPHTSIGPSRQYLASRGSHWTSESTSPR